MPIFFLYERIGKKTKDLFFSSFPWKTRIWDLRASSYQAETGLEMKIFTKTERFTFFNILLSLFCLWLPYWRNGTEGSKYSRIGTAFRFAPVHFEPWVQNKNNSSRLVLLYVVGGLWEKFSTTMMVGFRAHILKRNIREYAPIRLEKTTSWVSGNIRQLHHVWSYCVSFWTTRYLRICHSW